MKCENCGLAEAEVEERRKTMADDRHVDRYVRITNRERFLIVRALGLLESACCTIEQAREKRLWQIDSMDEMREICALSYIFCEENWLIDSDINTNKVVGVQRMEERDGADR